MGQVVERGQDMAKILVVQDAAFVRNWCSNLLREKGHEVVEAASCTEALEVYRQEKPDAVLLDVTTSGMDGVVTVQEIARIDPAARVAVVTAMGQSPEEMSDLLESGALDSVMQPFDGATVLDTVEKLVN